MPRVEPNSLPKEPKRSFPLVELDALVPTEGVGVDALAVKLSGALEAPKRGGVVFEMRKDVPGRDP